MRGVAPVRKSVRIRRSVSDLARISASYIIDDSRSPRSGGRSYAGATFRNIVPTAGRGAVVSEAGVTWESPRTRIYQTRVNISIVTG